MIAVSVVVPAYRSGAGIDRVVASIEAQTLEKDRLELVVVDDGSPDDTYQRITALARTRPWMRVHRIESSGWPSRPRNVGLELARGEYVLFMDHDDEVFPDGLRASYEYATACSSDVLSPKELKTSDPLWGLGNFTADIPNAIPRRGIDALLPMMPHKLYRREFLLEHGIRFPEGGRVLWEDVYFNVACFAHARVISVYSAIPVYLWHATGSNTSATYGPWDAEFWDNLDRLLAFVTATLDTPALAAARDKQLLHQYRLRVLSRLEDHVRSGRAPERLAEAIERGAALAERYVPEALDAALPVFARPQAYALRRRRLDLFVALARSDADPRGVAATQGLWWQGGALEIRTATRWVDAAGRATAFRSAGGRLLRVLPDDVEREIPADLLDVTDEVARASTTLTIRDRTHGDSWNLATRREVRTERADRPGSAPDDGDLVAVVVDARATLDPRTAAQGRPLGRSVWDVRGRCTLLGRVDHLPVRTVSDPLPALLPAAVAVAYRNAGGALSLDLAGQVRSLADDARPGPAVVTRSGVRYAVEAPLAAVHAPDAARVTGRAAPYPVPARVVQALLGDPLRRFWAPAARLLGRLGTVEVVAGPGGPALLRAQVTSPFPKAWLVVQVGDRPFLTRVLLGRATAGGRGSGPPARDPSAS